MTRTLAGLLAAAALCAGCAGPPTAAPHAAAAMRGDSARFIVLAVDNPLRQPAGSAGSSLAGYYAAARPYVQGSSAAATLAALAREHGLEEAAAWPIAALGWQCAVYSWTPGRARTEVLAALARDPRVRLVQPLQDFDTLATPVIDAGLAYNDPYVHLQRGFVDTGAARAHRVSTGAGVRVAVVDTGAATRHPDLQDRIVAVQDLSGEPAESLQTDRHGTQVAGVIAATGNNREGIVGMAPQAGIELYKACWTRPAAPAARCNSFTLAKALAAVLESDARIVNLSLGGPADPLLERLLDELLRQGRIVVGALPPHGRRSGFPTGTRAVIAAAVAGSPGPAAQDAIQAPGRDVLTLQPGGTYDYASGTSMAAAHVSGVAALLLAVEPRLDRDVLRSLLAGSEGQPLDAGAALAGLRQRRSAGR